MSYTALYRKFRPMKFDEMVGQEHITKTLKNQIINGRIGHAYLFNGGRGTGKTSSAKLLARAVNCLNPKEGEPCNECEICTQIIKGALTDVVEMDAASNNSVEDIRLIRDEVNFLPTLAKYRVYIIDEVHMLSTGAFNALLKTLEEPPEHVKFILATTEPQKLPATILSRCQRFDFRQISETDIIKRLKIICEESNIKITDKAISLIAILSEGAMRDGISILERCVQDGIEKIEEKDIRELAGIPEFTYINQIVANIINYDSSGALKVADEVFQAGKDVNNFLWEIVKYIRDIIVLKTTENSSIYSDEEIIEMRKLGKETTKERLLNLIYQLSELENTLKWSTQKKLMFQAGIIKACSKIENQGIEDLQNRITDLETKMSSTETRNESVTIRNKENISGKDNSNDNMNVQHKLQTEETMGNKISNMYETTMDKKTESDQENGNGVANWNKILENLRKNGKMIIYTNLINTTARRINDITLGVEFKNKLTDFGKKVLEQTDNRKELEKLVSIEYGKDMNVKFLTDSEAKSVKKEVTNIEKVANELDIPINIIDE